MLGPPLAVDAQDASQQPRPDALRHADPDRARLARGEPVEVRARGRLARQQRLGVAHEQLARLRHRDLVRRPSERSTRRVPATSSSVEICRLTADCT